MGEELEMTASRLQTGKSKRTNSVVSSRPTWKYTKPNAARTTQHSYLLNTSNDTKKCIVTRKMKRKYYLYEEIQQIYYWR